MDLVQATMQVMKATMHVAVQMVESPMQFVMQAGAVSWRSGDASICHISKNHEDSKEEC
jgi:hypothetical protein